jgi:MFS family permease
MAVVTNVYALGALIAVIYFVTAPANGVLYASQILITPPELQGRVISAAVTLLGLTGPLGPLLAGTLVDIAGQWAAFGAFALIVAVSTVALQRSRDVRDMPDFRPDTAPKPISAAPSDSDPTVSDAGADSIAA